MQLALGSVSLWRQSSCAGGRIGVPAGMAIGGIVGGVVGAVLGKLSAKGLKEAHLNRLVSEYNIEAARARAGFDAIRQEAALTFVTSLNRWDEDLTRERRSYHRAIDSTERRLSKARRYVLVETNVFCPLDRTCAS